MRRCNYFLLTWCALLSGACATLAPEQDPVLLKLTQLEGRLSNMEKSLDNDGLLTLQSQLLDTQNEISQLRGQIEQLQFEADGSAERLREAYAMLDQRVTGLEGGTSRSPLDNSFASSSNSVQPSDTEAYQEAFDLLKAARYDEANAAFSAFLTRYPTSAFSDNAQYWLGESFYVTRKFQEALTAFQKVLSQYPQSRKVPDAMLKVGLCYFELGDRTQAQSFLERVQSDYPGTTAARLATDRLKELF